MEATRERELFEAALALPAGERASYLARECPDEADRARLGRLLEAHLCAESVANGFLESGPLRLIAHEHIGPYRIVGPLGTGGMGEVYLVEQTEPVQRRVALKLLRAEFGSAEILARFDAERHTLALLDHPNVARILDAGSTGTGRPYVVVEYVPGPAITHYCDQHRLDIDHRLDLFLAVCAGVQHAHQRGIIHRDLKPSNVLVSEIDDVPQPKIIDFGIAKAMSPTADGRGAMTAIGQLVGTPDYMSPEQAERTPFDVDTRADVYALGALLCELLYGRLPYATIDVDAGLLQVARMVATREAERPSLGLEQDVARLEATARQRRTSGRALLSRLRGDIDRIALKALERDRARRYGSAAELAADLVRHRARQPVTARAPDPLYLASRFVQRHKAGVMVAIAAMAGLAAFGVFMTQQARETARERDRAAAEAATARRVAQFLVETLAATDPEKHLGKEPTARQLLDTASARLSSALPGEPAARAEIELAFGEIYHTLGEYNRSLEHLRQALELFEGLEPPDTRGRLSALRKIGRGLAQAGQVAEGERLTLQAIVESRRLLGESDPLHVDAQHDLGVVRHLQARYQEALELYRVAAAGRERLLGPTHQATAIAQTNVAAMHQMLGQTAEAERAYLEVIDRMSRSSGEDDSRVVIARFNLSTLYAGSGDYRRALEQQRKIVPRMSAIYGSDHPYTLTATGNLSSTLSNLGRHEESYEINSDLVRRLTATLGATHATTLMYRAALAYDAGMLGRRVEALRGLGEVIEEQRRRLGDSHRDVVYSRSGLATLQRSWGEHSAAIVNLAAALSASREVLGPEHRKTREILLMLADSSYALGDDSAGRSWVRAAREAGEDLAGSLDPYPALAGLRTSGTLPR